MIDDATYDDDGGNNEIDKFDDELDDETTKGEYDMYDEYDYPDDDMDDDLSDKNSFDSHDSHEIMGNDDGMMGFDRFPEIPESQTLDTKALRGGNSASSLLDPFGTGELFDESSAAASVALLGILLVLIVGACVYSSFRQTMIATPTHKNGGISGKQGSKESMASYSKRRE
jgi:hypothetical protein